MTEKFIGTRQMYDGKCGFHDVYDVGLPDGMTLHRFTDDDGVKYSAVYMNDNEAYRFYRDNEADMIKYVNSELDNDPKYYDLLKDKTLPPVVAELIDRYIVPPCNNHERDSVHGVYDIGLPKGMTLHRFIQTLSGELYSAIYIGTLEMCSCERGRELHMVDFVNRILESNPHFFDEDIAKYAKEA